MSRSNHSSPLRNTILAALTAVAAAATLSLGTGCSAADLSTKGQNGVADFSLQSAQCILGCPTDRVVLLGSSIQVQAKLTQRTEDAFVLRVKDASLATVDGQSQSCSCEDDKGGATIECTALCPVGQAKSVVVSADIQTKTPGEVPFELVDAKGAVVDASSIVTRPAAKLDATVQSGPHGQSGADITPGVDGAYTVHVGNDVDLRFTASDADGKGLVFTTHGVIPTYANDKALTATKDLADKFLGSPADEVAVAVAPGDDAINLRANGASATISFHVVK